MQVWWIGEEWNPTGGKLTAVTILCFLNFYHIQYVVMNVMLKLTEDL